MRYIGFYSLLAIFFYSSSFSQVTDSDRLFKMATDFVKEKRYTEAVSIFEELARNAGWTQKECEKNLKLLEKYWLNYLKDGTLLRENGRYFLSDPKGMQISNQVLIQMFLWWDSLDLD